jgi:hypothetical protein
MTGENKDNMAGPMLEWLESFENGERVWDTVLDEFYEVKDLKKLKRWLNRAYEVGRRSSGAHQ